MKKTTFHVLMISLFATFLYSCAPTSEQARQFNDDVIAQQVTVMNSINALEIANGSFNPAKIEPALKAATNQIEKSLSVLNGMSNIDPETDFFPLTVELIELFKSQVDNEYTMILEQYKLSDEEYDADATNGYLKSIDEAYTALSEKFSASQQAFANKYNLDLIEQESTEE